jgi:hypothetical protein
MKRQTTRFSVRTTARVMASAIFVVGLWPMTTSASSTPSSVAGRQQQRLPLHLHLIERIQLNPWLKRGQTHVGRLGPILHFGAAPCVLLNVSGGTTRDPRPTSYYLDDADNPMASPCLGGHGIRAYIWSANFGQGFFRFYYHAYTSSGTPFTGHVDESFNCTGPFTSQYPCTQGASAPGQQSSTTYTGVELYWSDPNARINSIYCS